jgi:hypothetical protein
MDRYFTIRDKATGATPVPVEETVAGIGDRRAMGWLGDLSMHQPPLGSARLRRDDEGRVFLVEAGRRRRLPSGLVAAALEPEVGAVLPAEPGSLEALEEGPPVAVVRPASGPPVLVADGRRFPLYGLPVPRSATPEEASLPVGAVIDVASAHVSRRQYDALGAPRRRSLPRLRRAAHGVRWRLRALRP